MADASEARAAVRRGRTGGPPQPPPSRIANYHKGLEHDEFGEVIESSYQSLLDALDQPTQANFEAIQLGPGGRKLVNPQAGFAEDLEGPNPSKLMMTRVPPKLDSPEAAGEAVELYWMALLRDVPFADFGSNSGIQQAAAELSGLSDFRGPKDTATGAVTPQTIFRGSMPGDREGPFVSQFLLKPIPYGSLTIDQRQQTAAPGIDFLTTFSEWLDVQDGFVRSTDQLDNTGRYIRNMRDLGHYVHVDALYEAYLNACLILLGMGAEVDDGNPYKNSQTQIGFGTFGGPHILSLVCEVATRALKAAWYQKWVVHKRLRPEAYGGLVHLRKTGVKPYALHNDVLDSQALAEVEQKYGTYLLPMAFPEGSPTHPSYGAGHATVAGACVTILKAWFKDGPIPDPVEATPDGLGLVPYTGAPLTIYGELDKVAANIAIGRNMAGVHWRTDYIESVRLGEHVATCILLEQSKHDYKTEQERNHTFTFTSFFDEKRRTVKNGELFDENGAKINIKCPK